MQFKNIDSLNITECCEHLNIKREDLPKALRDLKELSELENLVVSRLTFLLNEDRTYFESCSTIEQYEKYLASWIDGIHRSKATHIIAQLKAQAEEHAFYKTNQNTISGLEDYIKIFPNGKFTREAKISIVSKKKARKIRNLITLIIAIIVFTIVCLINYYPVSYLNVSGDVSFGNKGGNKIVPILTDANDINIDVSESSEWIGINRCSDSLTICVEPNTYIEEERTASIIVNTYSSIFGIQFNRVSKVINVSQKSSLPTYLSTNIAEINFDKYGYSLSNLIIAQTDGSDIRVSASESWFTVNKNIRVDGDNMVAHINLIVGVNNEESRNGEVVISCNEYEKHIKVSQSSGLPTYLKTDISEISFDKYGNCSSNYIVAETDGCGLQVSATESWFTVLKSIGRNGDNMIASITLSSSSNNEGSKTGEVIISCNDYVKRVKVSQASGLATYFRVEKASLTMAEEGSGEGRYYPIDVDTDGTSWSVKSAPDWLTTNATNSRLEVSVKANTGKVKRGTITIMSNNGDMRDISVTQKGDPTNFRSAKSTVKFGTSSDYEYVTIYNDSHKILEVNEYESWLSATAIGNDEIKISCISNSNERRSGTVYVHCGDEQISITVRQDGWTTCWNCGGHGRFQCSYPGLWGAGGYHYVQEFVMNYYTGMGNYVYNPCPNCGGSGTIKCSQCDGIGRKKSTY